MDDERWLDGNAIGGVLAEALGREMTDVEGRCAVCRKVSLVGTLIVYQAGPGDVVRCPHCGSVVLVIVATAAGARLEITALHWVAEESAAGPAD